MCRLLPSPKNRRINTHNRKPGRKLMNKRSYRNKRNEHSNTADYSRTTQRMSASRNQNHMWRTKHAIHNRKKDKRNEIQKRNATDVRVSPTHQFVKGPNRNRRPNKTIQQTWTSKTKLSSTPRTITNSPANTRKITNKNYRSQQNNRTRARLKPERN